MRTRVPVRAHPPMAMGAISIAAALGPAAAADVINDPADLAASAAIVTFESSAPGAQPSPLTVDGLTFSAPTGLGIASVDGYGANGTEVSNLTLKPDTTIFYDGGPYSPIHITFPAPISQFLVGWFDPNYPGNVAKALGAGGEVLEEGSPALGPKGGLEAAWIGFVRPQADIHAVDIVPASPDDWYGIDNVMYVVGVVARCTADLDGDNMVDGADLSVLLAGWGIGGAADLNGSGTVDGADLGILLAEWGSCE